MPATPSPRADNPQEFLDIQGRDAVQRYLVDEVQRSTGQGVNINDKHIEIIVRQMLRKVRVDQPGDTELLPGELVDRFEFEEQQPRPGRGRRARHGADGAARRDQGVAQHRELPRGGVLPGDDPGAHRGGDLGARTTCSGSRRTSSSASSSRPGRVLRRTSRPARRASAEAALEALAGEALEGLGQAEYNPFLEDGVRRRHPDDEAAGLALAATTPVATPTTTTTPRTPSSPIDGADGADAEATDDSPFLAEAEEVAAGTKELARRGLAAPQRSAEPGLPGVARRWRTFDTDCRAAARLRHRGLGRGPPSALRPTTISTTHRRTIRPSRSALRGGDRRRLAGPRSLGDRPASAYG